MCGVAADRLVHQHPADGQRRRGAVRWLHFEGVLRSGEIISFFN